MLDLKHRSGWPEIPEIHREDHHLYACTNDRIIHVVVRNGRQQVNKPQMTQINSGSFPQEGHGSTGRGADNAPQFPVRAINLMPAQRILLAGSGAPFATPRPAGFLLLQNDLEDRSCLIHPPLRDRPHFRSGKDDPPLYSIGRSRSRSRGKPPVCCSTGRPTNCSGRPRVEPCPETAR